jgi:hypothetical protein
MAKNKPVAKKVKKLGTKKPISKTQTLMGIPGRG